MHRVLRPAAAWLAGLTLALALAGDPSVAGPASPGAKPTNPELVAHDYNGPDGAQATHPLTIGRLDIAVLIAGGVAHTTVTARFQNPTNDPLEGDFTLALPAGSVVTGYALDVHGAMVDGVLVGKRKATLAYQRRVRQGVDPGIAEVTRDNAFRTHVFPIMPGAGRTVRLAFVSPISAGAPYALPLATLDPVGAASILVRTADGAQHPALTGPDGLDLQWTSDADGLTARATGANLTLAGALTIGAVLPAQPVTLTRHHAGDTFFEIDAAAPAPLNRNQAQAQHVRIYWDRSLSRRHDDTGAELALLRRYLRAVGARTIDVVTFGGEGPALRTFDAPETAADDTVAALKAVDYEGATSMRGVFAAAPWQADACLFFSDGNVTLDAYRLERVRCPLFAISSAADANHGFLTALARESGGEALDLASQPEGALLSRLTDRTSRVVALTGADGEPIDFTVLPAAPGRLRVIGRASGDGKVTATLADGQTLAFDLDGLTPVEHDGLGDLWAADRVAELNAADNADPARSLGFARRYGVAGGDAVYLVLESLNDYINAEIAPPESAGKPMQADYAEAVAQREQEKAQRQSERLNLVIDEWTEQKAWWSGKEKPPVRAKTETGPTLANRRPARPVIQLHEAPVATAVTPMAAPPPPPPPPPSAMARVPVAVSAFTSASADARGGTSEVIVTGEKRQATGGAIQVEVQPWDPKRPYLTALKAAKPADFQAVFKAQERKYGDLPAFYLDVAELEFRQGRAPEARAMALGALELPSADTATLTILADRMMRYGDDDRAIWLYEKVLSLDPDRPQPRRLLALALVDRAEHIAKAGGSVAAQRADYQRAMQLLNEVITRTWDQAFDQVELVALMEANHILPRLQALGVKDIPLDPRLRARLDVDMRVVLDWYIDATDMDLWVDEPTGERAIYNNPRTQIGGRLSHDMTQGYGPEEYLLRHAPGGDYVVRVNIFRTDRLNPNGSITVRAHLFRNYGRADETSKVLEIELKPGEDGARVVGDVKVGGGK